MSTDRQKFDNWIDTLRVDVVQDEYGFEEGEFEVTPELWWPMYKEGLTPSQAFRRALDAHAEARREEDAERMANWERIRAEDASAVARAALAKSRGT